MNELVTRAEYERRICESIEIADRKLIEMMERMTVVLAGEPRALAAIRDRIAHIRQQWVAEYPFSARVIGQHDNSA